MTETSQNPWTKPVLLPTGAEHMAHITRWMEINRTCLEAEARAREKREWEMSSRQSQ